MPSVRKLAEEYARSRIPPNLLEFADDDPESVTGKKVWKHMHLLMNAYAAGHIALYHATHGGIVHCLDCGTIDFRGTMEERAYWDDDHRNCR